MTATVRPQNNGALMGGRARPGLLIATSPRAAVWISLDEAHALADEIHDQAEAMEARLNHARHSDEIHEELRP